NEFTFSPTKNRSSPNLGLHCLAPRSSQREPITALLAVGDEAEALQDRRARFDTALGERHRGTVLDGVRHASGNESTINATAAVRLQHRAAPQPDHAVDDLDARECDRGAVEVGDHATSGTSVNRTAIGCRTAGELLLGGC